MYTHLPLKWTRHGVWSIPRVKTNKSYFWAAAAATEEKQHLRNRFPLYEIATEDRTDWLALRIINLTGLTVDHSEEMPKDNLSSFLNQFSGPGATFEKQTRVLITDLFTHHSSCLIAL